MMYQQENSNYEQSIFQNCNSLPGKLIVKQVIGTNGKFKVASIQFSFIEIEVNGTWIKQFDEGEYLGTFQVLRIFMHPSVSTSTGVVTTHFKGVVKVNKIFNTIEELLNDNFIEPTNSNNSCEVDELKQKVSELESDLLIFNENGEAEKLALNSKLDKQININAELDDNLQSTKVEISAVCDQLELEKQTVQSMSTTIETLENEITSLKDEIKSRVNFKGEHTQPIKTIKQPDTTSGNTQTEISQLFGGHFKNAYQIKDLPDQIFLKEIDEDIISDRKRLSAISNLLAIKNGGDYRYVSAEQLWERVNV